MTPPDHRPTTPPDRRHLLILGGTTEARALAAALATATAPDGKPGLRVTSSLAGRVARPRLPAA